MAVRNKSAPNESAPKNEERATGQGEGGRTLINEGRKGRTSMLGKEKIARPYVEPRLQKKTGKNKTPTDVGTSVPHRMDYFRAVGGGKNGEVLIIGQRS